MSSLMRARTRGRQAGAATLVVVMVLFFIMSLVAAYASRNIIFEQRTSANVLQATSSLEAAEAGLNWAVSLLNSGRIDNNCSVSTDPAHGSFRERYLSMEVMPDGTGKISVSTDVSGGALQPRCWYNAAGGAWVCHCPSDAGSPGVISSEPNKPTANFRLRFTPYVMPSGQPERGLVNVEVIGCSEWTGCPAFEPAEANKCHGTVCAVLAMQPVVKSTPGSAITVRGDVDVGGAPLAAYNTAVGSTGATLVAGGTIAGQSAMDLRGPAGTPAEATVRQAVPALSSAAFTAERMFSSVFGMWPATFAQQPAMVSVDCTGTCSSTDIRGAAARNPGLAIYAQGDVRFDGGGSIGTAERPVVVVSTGHITFSAPTTIYGVVYSRAAAWTSAGSGTIKGAVVAEGDLQGTGSFRAEYDPEVLRATRWFNGNYVIVPSSWKDFQ